MVGGGHRRSNLTSRGNRRRYNDEINAGRGIRVREVRGMANKLLE